MAKKTDKVVYYVFSSSRCSYFVNGIINDSIALGSLFPRYFKFQIQKCPFSFDSISVDIFKRDFVV